MSEWKTIEDIRREDLHTAYERGRYAFQAGDRYTDNPYTLTSSREPDADLVYEWCRGWLAEESDALHAAAGF